MKKSIFFDFLKLAAGGGLLWLILFLLPINCSTDTFSISVKNEEKLGKLIAEDVILKDGQAKIIHTKALDSAVTAIQSRLLSNLKTGYNYKIQVISNPDINAFTIPGGYIFICKGLIDFVKTPEELAAVLAHEMGHAEERHVLSKMTKEIGITILFSIITGGDPALLAQIGRQALSTVFDRDQEKEADDYALTLLEKSAIDPQSIALFFKRMNDEMGGYDENLEILMTHPHNKNRIKAAMKYKTKSGFKPVKMDIDWEKVQGSLKK